MKLAPRVLIAGTSVWLCASGAWAAFDPPQNVSQNPGESVAPTVSLDGTVTQFVVWADNTTPGGGSIGADFRLHCVGFPPGGAAGPPSVDPNAVSLDESLLPRTVVDSGGTLHVLFQNKVLSRYDVFHVQTSDCVNWSASVNVSSNVGDSVTPAVAVDAIGQLHAVWADDTEIPGAAEVFYSRRSAAGVWSFPQNVSRRTGSLSSFPDIAVTSDNIPNVVWIDTTSGVKSVFFSRGSTGGSFSTGKNISKELFSGPVGDTGPAIARGVADRLRVVWAGINSANGKDIFYQAASPPGFGFSNPKNISNNAGASIAPRIGVDAGDQSHVVWADNTIDTEFDVFYAKISSSGSVAEGPLVIDQTSARSLAPDIAVSIIDELHVCWQDDASSAPGANFEIVCSDAGESIPPVTAATTTPGPDPLCGGFFKADPVTVTLTATDNSGSVASTTYKLDNQQPQTNSFGTCPTTPPFDTNVVISGTGAHSLLFSSTDCEGNKEGGRKIVIPIDNLPPVTHADLTGSCNNCTDYAGAVQVTLRAEDQGPAGVKETRYRVDGGPLTLYGGTFTVAGNGVHTVEYFSEDKACNVEPTNSRTFKIGDIAVQILRPVPGVLYVNNHETLSPTLVAIAFGNRIDVVARVTSSDAMIDWAHLCVHTEPNKHCDADEVIVFDGTDKPSGATYTLRYKLPSLMLQPRQFLRVEATDRSPILRKAAAEVEIIVPQ